MTDQEGAISGRISDRPVGDLFQWLHESRGTGVARFRTALGSATVWVRDGELVDAEMGRFHQDAAVLRLMRIQDGEYEVEPRPVNQRRMIKQSTALLLAEGRQRAPRPGPARVASAAEPPPTHVVPAVSANPGSGEPEVERGEPRLRDRVDEAESEPGASTHASRSRRGPRRVDSGAHTLLNVKAVPRLPGAPPGEGPPTPERASDGERGVKDEPARAIESPVRGPAVESQGPARGPAARRRGPGWSPTAGGPGQAPEPTPSARSASSVPGRPATDAPRSATSPAEATTEEAATRSGRTRFMFGVTGPGAEHEPAAHVEPITSAPASPPAVRWRDPPTPAPGAGVSPPAPQPITSAPASPAAPRWRDPPTPAPGAGVSPVPPEDSTRSSGDGRRRRARAAARAQAPFEPALGDRTLLRPGPVPPPPGQPVMVPASPSQSIPVGVAASPSPEPASFGAPAKPPPPAEPVAHEGTTTAIMGSSARPPRPAPAVVPFPAAAPVLVDEEYSHPISVPTAPSVDVGPGGTWMLGNRGSERPLPEDPYAERTAQIRPPDAVQAREPSLSGNVKAGGTAHVGRYEVLLRLARGGMGTVYLCRVTGEGGFRRLFALKVIRDHLNTNQAYVQMLLEEARIASRLSHPNIVSIIDIDTFAGQHYLVMDYVEGCTLSELLKAHPKTRPPELVVPIVLDALTGLHAAHSMRGDDGSPQPVVHCDFSPQNMLVGVNGTCRLTDFGVSKAADALLSGPGRGKPGYLSPEQVRGLPLDPRSDVFSAGVVLWNALTGEQLFDGEDPQAVLHQVVTRKVPRPSSVGLHPPACFDRICLRALEHEPEKRYQTAEQMLTDLRKVAIAEDLLAPSSAVGHWVQETFGAQIELRRQAAGLQPNPIGAALALRERVAVGASGHPEALARDASATGHDPDASMTMMLGRSGAPREQAEDDREGFGARTRVVVIVAALAFIGAGVVTLLVRPDLLQGGVIDERGQYIDLSVNPGQEPGQEPRTGTTGDRGEADTATGTPAAVVAGATGAGTGGETDTDRDTDTDDGTDTASDTETLAQDDGKAKLEGGRGKGKAPADDGKATGDAKGDAKGKGKAKAKTEPGTEAPPPDLDELFRPPGG